MAPRYARRTSRAGRAPALRFTPRSARSGAQADEGRALTNGPPPSGTLERDQRRAEPTTLPADAVLVVLALTVAAGAQGAFYGPAQRAVGAILAAAGIATMSRVPSLRPDVRLGLLRAAAGLAAWSLASAAMAGEPRRAASTVLLLAGVITVVVVCRRCPRPARHELVGAILLIGAVLAMTGWAGVAWQSSPWALEDQGLWRGATAITYANAAAGVLVPLALLAFARASSPSGARGDHLAACVLLTGAGATLSRGGLVALAAGAVVLGVLLGFRALLRGGGPAILGAVIALSGLVPSMPSSSPPRPALAVAGLFLGLLATTLLVQVRRATVARTLVGLGLAGGLVLVAGGPVMDAAGSIAQPRLSLGSPDRVGQAGAALREAARNPVTGTGPGSLSLRWVDGDGRTLRAEYVHNEYLQILAELGAVGVALLLVLIVEVGRTVARGRKAAPSLPTWAGVAAALVAMAVHALFDFGWHVPVVPLTGAALVGIVTPPTTNERKP